MPYQASLEDAKAVINTLRDYKARAKALESAIAGKSHFSPDELQALRADFSKLKDDLEHNAKVCEGVKSRSALTEIQSSCLCPAVRDMLGYFKAKRNSHPVSGDWGQALYSVIDYANIYLGPLEAQFPGI